MTHCGRSGYGHIPGRSSVNLRWKNRSLDCFSPPVKAANIRVNRRLLLLSLSKLVLTDGERLSRPTGPAARVRRLVHVHAGLYNGGCHDKLPARAGFKGSPGGPGPRPPTNMGPPTKPFIYFFSFVICVCLEFVIFRLLQSPT